MRQGDEQSAKRETVVAIVARYAVTDAFSSTWTNQQIGSPLMFRTSIEVPVLAYHFRKVDTLPQILATALRLDIKEKDLGRTVGAFR
jgi:hypothetical protein